MSCFKGNDDKETKGLQNTNKDLSENEQLSIYDENILLDSVFTIDNEFINNELLQKKCHIELKKYLINDCPPMKMLKSNYKENFEGLHSIGDIDNDNVEDFVFVLEPLTFCENGESYYFSNPEIPRLYTESLCCHPHNIENIGDIDEDGIDEIAQYFSSCASRYKSISVWTLKENNWKEIGCFTFALNDIYNIPEDFDKLYKKKSKGILEFLEISDLNMKNEMISEWKTINMN
jgi:hypothetical protein